MPAEQILSNAQLVTADRMFLGTVVLRDGKIVDIAEGRSQGQGLFGSFCGCLTKGTRRKGETIISVRRKCRICTRYTD